MATSGFTEVFGNKIGKITPGGTITEYDLPHADSQPAGITLGPDGVIWFTENGGDRIGTITSAGDITEYDIPSGSQPYGITVGPDHNLWMTENGGFGSIDKVSLSGVVLDAISYLTPWLQNLA